MIYTVGYITVDPYEAEKELDDGRSACIFAQGIEEDGGSATVTDPEGQDSDHWAGYQVGITPDAKLTLGDRIVEHPLVPDALISREQVDEVLLHSAGVPGENRDRGPHRLLRPGKDHYTDQCPKQSRVQRKGHGTALLKQILSDADRESVDLYLEVSPSDGLSYDQLASWYKRHGFKELKLGLFKRRHRSH